MSVRTSLEETIDTLARLVLELEPASCSGAEAARLVSLFSIGEHACQAGKARCAKVVATTGQYANEGHHDAASWLAATSGDTKAGAKDLLETAAELERLPELAGAFCSGELSGKEALEIARAGALDPSSESELVRTARDGSLGELREKADAVRAAARAKEDDEQRHRRLRARRMLSSFVDRDGALSGRFVLTPEDGAVVLGRLEQLADEIFKQARADERPEPRGAYLADALVALAGGEMAGRQPGKEPSPAGPSRSSRPDYTILMRVDLEALVRGHLEKGEECVIDGTGHVPVSVVQRFVDLAKLRLVVTRGTDLCSVFSFSRTIPTALKTALVARDRTCVVPGCASSFNLEIDHIKEFARGGPTTLSNLCRLCSFHHRLKSVSGYRIEGGPGAWRWIAPTSARAGRPESPPASPPEVAPEVLHKRGDTGPEPGQERCEQVSLLL